MLENFKVGYEISITMEIKPRNSTGLILSVYGKKDFMILELLENEVIANVENGKGPFHASYKLGNKFSLCDGNWHRIHGKSQYKFIGPKKFVILSSIIINYRFSRKEHKIIVS